MNCHTDRANEILDTFIFYAAKHKNKRMTEGFFLVSDYINGIIKQDKLNELNEFLKTLDASKPLVQELLKCLED